MANVRGRNVIVEIAVNVASPVTVLSVAKAINPAIVAPGHGLSEWTAGTLIGVSGLPDLEGQGLIVNTPIDSSSFHANGLDTRGYRGVGGSGKFYPANQWATLAECTSYELTESGGGSRLATATILNAQERSRPGLLPQQSLTLQLIAQTVPSVAFLFLQSARLARTAVLIRIAHKSDGSLRICAGHPTYPTEGVGVGAMGSSNCVVNIDGLFLSLAGVYAPPAPPPPPPPPPPPGGDYFSEDYMSEDYFA